MAEEKSLAEELGRLADLRDRGVLTDAEFQAQKTQILAISPPPQLTEATHRCAHCGRRGPASAFGRSSTGALFCSCGHSAVHPLNQARAHPGGYGSPPDAHYQGPPYSPQPYGFSQPWDSSRRATNGMAIASMVLGILWVWWIGSILALVFGYIGLNQIQQRNEQGRGMAIAGVVLGWVGVGTGIIVLILALIGAASNGG
jgi:hypothetical protein